MDTLCFDKENNCFVIIEYKKGKSDGMIDQGYSYLSLFSDNRADFILEYNETLGKNIKRNEVDWSQSKIIFISPQFTDYQKSSINFKNIPFELWEISRYSDDFIGLNRISIQSNVDINGIGGKKKKPSRVKQPSKEIKPYDEEYHLKNKKKLANIIELYYKLKERILGLGENIELHYHKTIIVFKHNEKFIDLFLQTKKDYSSS